MVATATKKKTEKKVTPKRLTKKEVEAAVKGATQGHLKGMLDEKDKRIFQAARRVKTAQAAVRKASDEKAKAQTALLKLMQKRKGKTYDDGELRVYLDMKEAVKVEESKGKKKRGK